MVEGKPQALKGKCEFVIFPLRKGTRMIFSLVTVETLHIFNNLVMKC